LISGINHNIKEILELSHTVAVVGLSDSPTKPSHQVARYLQQAGYRIIPVNPRYDEILGERCYADLKSIPIQIDIVDIFRNPAVIVPIVEQAITLHPRAIWLQLGVINETAAQSALDQGIPVIMDRCIKIEHMHYF